LFGQRSLPPLSSKDVAAEVGKIQQSFIYVIVPRRKITFLFNAARRDARREAEKPREPAIRHSNSQFLAALPNRDDRPSPVFHQVFTLFSAPPKPLSDLSVMRKVCSRLAG
jgi:hypothetical protein